MFELIHLEDHVLNGPKIGFYEKFNEKIYRQIVKISESLKNLAVIHINATPRGGGVAELLKGQVPLERSLGLESHWLSFRAPDDFFVVSKKIHNLFQGKPGKLIKKDLDSYIRLCADMGESFREKVRGFESGIVVIHDPQPLPLINFVPSNFKPIFRLHIDTSDPNPLMLNFFKPYIKHFSSVAVSSKKYIAPFDHRLEKAGVKIKVIHPAIDPLSEKNKPMDVSEAREILTGYGLDFSRPIISQVSRFDPWKDPLGVIRAYYLVKKEIPGLQLVLAGLFEAQDDPESEVIFEEVKAEAGGDPDIFLFSNPGVLKGASNDKFINAVYTVSDVVLQKSIREGFGLTVAEAMWKGKAVIAGKTDGTEIQIKNGKNGILVESPEEAARAIVRLLKNESLRERLGKAAHQSVRKNFLLPRFILDNLKLYNSILNGSTRRAP